MRKLFSIPLFLIGGFCVFGYLASGEVQEPMARLPWQLGYGGMGALTIGGALFLLFGKKAET